MKAGETGVLAALVVFLAGGLFVGLSKMPEQELFFRTPEPEEELSVYEQLKLELRPYHFGNLPKSESFRGDTTVLSADMDYIMYSVPQIDLHITRLLRNMEFTGLPLLNRHRRNRVQGPFPQRTASGDMAEPSLGGQLP